MILLKIGLGIQMINCIMSCVTFSSFDVLLMFYLMGRPQNFLEAEGERSEFVIEEKSCGMSYFRN
jgi:hypothetical protein